MDNLITLSHTDAEELQTALAYDAVNGDFDGDRALQDAYTSLEVGVLAHAPTVRLYPDDAREIINALAYDADNSNLQGATAEAYDHLQAAIALV
jgi:hypothetical protein